MTDDDLILMLKNQPNYYAHLAAIEIEALRTQNVVILEFMETQRKIMREKDDTIEALRAKNARLREALKPFAEAADIYNLNDFLPSIDEEYTSFQIGLCRAARAAMGESYE